MHCSQHPALLFSIHSRNSKGCRTEVNLPATGTKLVFSFANAAFTFSVTWGSNCAINKHAPLSCHGTTSWMSNSTFSFTLLPVSYALWCFKDQLKVNALLISSRVLYTPFKIIISWVVQSYFSIIINQWSYINKISLFVCMVMRDMRV